MVYGMRKCTGNIVVLNSQYDLAQYLISCGYHHLPEHEKPPFLMKFKIKFKITVHVQYQQCPLWQHIMQNDKIDCMKALLQLTPLIPMQNHSIPSEYPWVESLESMKEVLYKEQARWSPEGCVCVNHDEGNLNEETQLCLMKDLAFTMLASELFCLGLYCNFNKYKPKHCMKYLLDKAPNLITMKTFKLPLLYCALKYHPSVAELLLETHLPVRNATHTLAYIFSKWNDYSILEKATHILGKDNVKQIGSFRDHDGNTLLHKLFLREPSYVVSDQPGPFKNTLKLLLYFGVDPARMNSIGQTVFDIATESFFRVVDNNDHELITIYQVQYLGLLQILLPSIHGEHYELTRPLLILLDDQRKRALNGSLYLLSNIEKIAHLIWMYDPRGRVWAASMLKDFISAASTINTGTNALENVISALNELRETVQSVRPLQLLSRLSILQHVQWQDVKQLPLPASLKRYVCFGDISQDHKIHDIIASEWW